MSEDQDVHVEISVDFEISVLKMLSSLVLFFCACTVHVVQSLNSPCVQYLEDLKSELADAEGKPKDVYASPTSVFCIPDYGKHKGSTMLHSYFSTWWKIERCLWVNCGRG